MTAAATGSVGGGCQCGAIRYTAHGRPARHSLCHCDACRRSSGGYVVGWALFPREAVTVTGTPIDDASPPGTTRQFCGTCGTGLFYLDDTYFPGQVDIQSATFDDPDAIPPQARIQMADAPGWTATMTDLPSFQRFPGAA